MDHFIEYHKAVGEKVRRIREDLCWSQSYLGSVAELDRSQIQRIEKGKPFTLATLIKVSVALGRQPWEFLDVGYELPVNTDLEPHPARSPGCSETVDRIVESSFMDVPRTTKEIVEEGAASYGIALNSSAVSGRLGVLVARGQLVALPTENKTRFMYCKRKK